MALGFGRKNEIVVKEEQWKGPQVEAPRPAEGIELKPAETIERPFSESEAGVQIAPSPAVATTVPARKDESAQYKRIESVLEENLGELYFQMDEAHRKLFKEEGEKTVRAIDQLVSSAKATAQKILYLVRRWLLLIPGINKFFLEQEAKIKTDKIIGITSEGDGKKL